ncbi:hypothetical protein PVT68_17450 [Microbulbifer bruguierae]|uniref:Uncharacterized protein n=1 Tax=Microbulbifer bruguierae TaxID=3029061 RepID=A0ABY8NDM1_9GAMM|nr:hypothetical protein [Microbulbifer bruguierae]WGL16534.1 hypothetical protein PVT68_17450 [Microbulbifer bruguierae]
MNMIRFLSAVSLVVLPMLSHGLTTDEQRNLSIQLTQTALHINKGAPQLIDEDTRLDSVSTVKNIIIYNNTMVNYTVDQFNVAEFEVALKAAVIDPLCANTALGAFRELGVVMAYRYLDKDGNFIVELSQDMGECG